MSRRLAFFVLALTAACSSSSIEGQDARTPDATAPDAASPDAAGLDAAGAPDGMPEPDAGEALDAGALDAGALDAGAADALPGDATLPPIIHTFTATPAFLPRGGGTVTLGWSVEDADRVTITPGVGQVTGRTSAEAVITSSTTFTLTAENEGGTVTATATVIAGALFVDPAAGSDANPGTRALPLRTLAAAAAQALRGDTIHLLDGTHVIQFVRIPEGVHLRAVNTGVPRVQLGTGNGALVLGGNNTVHGLHINSAGAFGFFQITQGTLRIEELHYTAPSGNYALVSASGSAIVDLIAPSDGEWCRTQCNTPFAVAVDDAQVNVHGGRISGFSGTSSLFQGHDRGRLSLTGVTIEDGQVSGAVIILGNTSLRVNQGGLSLIRSTIRNAVSNAAARAIEVGFGSGSLLISDSIISDNQGHGIVFDSSSVNYSPLTHSATITGSRLERNRIGIQLGLAARARLFLEDTVIAENRSHGIECRFTATGCFIRMSGGAVSGNLGRGLDTVNEANKTNDVRLRGVTITANALHGLYLAGLAGSRWDLGTASDPGGNTIRDNGGTADPGLFTSDTNDVIWAVGNIWIPLEQGSDAMGRYVPALGEDDVEVAGPVGAGRNYRLPAGAELRL